MQLALSVFSVVLGVTIVLALAGIVIDGAPRVTSAMRVVSDGISGLARVPVVQRVGA